MSSLPAALAPPVAVGGVGGSGTRIVAQMLQAAGLHIGQDLNPASDTLWFTLLFKRARILQCDEAEFDAMTGILAGALAGTARFDAATVARILDLASTSRAPLHARDWLEARARSLIAVGTGDAPTAAPRRWGWKEPNTHVVIERLWQRLPTLRYVHVVRHGLDMAYSANQNQLRLWGEHVLGSDGPPTPERSLAYWCRVHRRMQHLLAANPQRMYWLDYDALCREPIAQAETLCRFLGCDFATVGDVLAQVRPPAEPRHAGECLDGFDPDDLAYVESLGYRVHR